ncbi:hypothetical protein [Streptomyces griseicoloratus]|uniref:hypothetical protein n=1 Tax=Streptomyces griseicoloratus TaxID=2752516 RepID=UPI001CB7488B|nr:hypothetical protein [Streptomyces griseicoloratus]
MPSPRLRPRGRRVEPARLTILERTVNGQPGLVAQQDGVIVTVYAFAVAGDRITRIWGVRNPREAAAVDGEPPVTPRCAGTRPAGPAREAGPRS